jgi:hypothetical protein
MIDPFTRADARYIEAHRKGTHITPLAWGEVAEYRRRRSPLRLAIVVGLVAAVAILMFLGV